MVDFTLKRNLRFTREEKESCRPAIERITELSQKIRNKGPLLELEDAVANEENPFVKFAVMMLTANLSPELLKKAMLYRIVDEGCEGAALLERLIITHGAVQIQEGENLWHVRNSLLGMLGVDFAEEW